MKQRTTRKFNPVKPSTNGPKHPKNAALSTSARAESSINAAKQNETDRRR